ncbi:MAG: NAD(P)H-dependent oxidoreductase subunit E [Eggerthellaceae bacterium]|nr:NAD(P)H-dependent oxidoreductase subunit E [Eggerthellaceae bacterium]
MPNCRTVVPFAGTPEQEERLRAVIAEHKGTQGPLMPVLHEAQEIYGYLPEEVQVIISEELDIPLAEIYGVSTFYSRFTLNPKGENRISVCLGTACYVKGAADVLAEVEAQIGCKAGSVTPDGKFSIDADRCVGACGLAPIMIVNGDVYGHMTPDQVEGILAKYRGEVA